MDCKDEKVMEDHLLPPQQFLKKSHVLTRLANKRASFFKTNEINDI
jgi:hypothetical protein